MKKDHAKIRDERTKAAEPDDEHAAQERNAGLAIGVLALVVIGLLLAVVMGATDVFRP